MSTPSLIAKHKYVHPDRNEAVSTFPAITEKQAQSLLRVVTPVTLSYTDLQGHTIQLWKYKQIFAASVEKNGMITLISGNKIHNGLLPQEKGSELLQRLDSAKLKKWHFSYKKSTGKIFIWPFLTAAGKDKYEVAYRAILSLGHKDATELTPTQYKLFKITRDHFKDGNTGDLAGAKKESRGVVLMRDGNPLLNKRGRPFDHQEEVQQGQRGVKRVIETLKNQLKRHNLPPTERSQIRKELSLASRLLAYTERFIRSKPWNHYRGEPPHKRGAFSSSRSPAMRAFEQKVQQTRLTDSYNATHQKNPILPKGARGGSIGGVACSTAYIEGLFKNPETLFEEEHFFCVPGLPDKRLPFSNMELRQILRELAIGVYAHSTIPFFSLHFNEQADQYPVIHPVYENTLVGRVISMLDYIMKGYLNGGVFTEDFIDDWHRNPDWGEKEKTALAQLVDFQEYCERHHLGGYVSLRDFQKIIGMGSQNVFEQLDRRLGEAVGVYEQESDTLKNLKGFRNSFRIIAKQNSIRKEGNLFLIDADFDVLYTIDPSPEYKAALDVHMRKYGSLPPSYRNLENAYRMFCQHIHDHMAKLPICRDYFAMLGVINFFSGYFSTLKKHRKVPVLPAMQIPPTKGAPPLFPYLPIREVRLETLRTNPRRLIAAVFAKHKAVMERYLWQMYGNFFTPSGARVSPERDAFYRAIRSELQDQLIQSTSNVRIVETKVKNSREIQESIDRNATAITNGLEQSELAFIHHVNRDSNIDVSRTFSNFLQKVHTGFPDEWLDVMELPLPQIRIMTDLQPLEIETGVKIVGGCGMNLKEQSVRVCQVARQILLNHEAWLKQAAPEEWTEVFYGPEKRQGFVFRLPYESAPVSFHDHYEWMESLLVSSETDDTVIQERLDIEKAMSEKDKEAFIELVHVSTTLNVMKDRFQRTLMHHAACLEDSFYLETLVDKKINIFVEDVHGYQPVHYAAMHGSVLNLEILERVGGAQVLDVPSRNGSTPLITAIQHGQLEVVRYLLSKNVSFSMLSEGYSTLHCALHHGSLPIIYEVLASSQTPQWINRMSKEGGTPLMLACELDSADLVEKMLSMEADPTLIRSDGVTAVEIGISRNCVTVVALLLNRVSLTSQAIETVAKQGSAEMLDLLVAHPLFYPYQNFYKDTPLLIAIRHGNINGAHRIIQRCPEKRYLMSENNGKESAFSLAATLGAWDLIKELDKKDVMDEQAIKNSLELLLRADYAFELGPFLDRCKLNNEELETLALKAAQVGNHQALSFGFFPRGVRREVIIGPKGWMLAHYLAKSDGLFLFRKIMNQKKDILLPLAEEGGKTLPYIASENKSLRVLRLSLQQVKQAEVRLERHFNDRHLFYAAVETGDLECVQLFLNIFSDRKLELVNVALDDTGVRASLLAAKLGSLKLLRLFVREGADIKIEDQYGDNALCHALRAHAFNIIDYLLKEHLAAVMTSRALLIAAVEDDEAFFIKMIGLNRSQRNLDQALFLAVQERNTQAFSRLYQHGASLDYMAEDGSTCLSLAQATRQENILRILQPLKEEETSPMTELIALIRNKDGIAQAIRVIQSWPPNEIVQIEHNEKLIWGTPLQLLLRILNKKTPETEIAPLLRHPELDVNIQDSEGNTLTHLLLNAEIFPVGLEKINWESLNHLGESPLHVAAKSEKSRILDSVLRCPVSVNARDHQGKTPLVHAVAAGQLENVELLLAKGADVNTYDIRLLTPLVLSYLSPRPSLSILKRLLVAGANPNQMVTIKRVSPLALALHSTSDEFARCLLFNGADSRATTLEGQTLLHAAAGMGKSLLLNLFVAKGLLLDAKDRNGMQPIHIAANEGKTKTAEAIYTLQPSALNAAIDNPEEGSLQGATSLHVAAQGNQFMTTQFLLQKYVDLEAKTRQGKNAFSFAAGFATKAVMDLFSPYKLSKDPKVLCSALASAITYDNIDVVIDLYLRGVSINAEIINGFTGIQLASLHGSLQATQWLLEHGADPFHLSPTEEDSFQLAAANRCFAQFNLLLEHAEPDLDELRNHKETLLHTAAKAGRINHVVYLIKNFAAMNVQDVKGHLPIHVAIKNGHHAIVRLLLACSADDRSIPLTEFVSEDDEVMQEILTDSDVWMANSSAGDTPLHIAIQSGNLLAIMLMIYTENINQKNSKGETPFYLAKRLKNQEACRHLINAGAGT